MAKYKATYKQMIQIMKAKGISFNLISEKEAIYYLKNQNYYFELTAFRNNFKKSNGTYIDLDFQYLIEIATIDSDLRKILLDMSLDIEHSLKVKLLDMITQDPNEDGYSIVRRFKGFSEWNYSETIKFMMKPKEYKTDFYNKHHINTEIWAFLECAGFGTLAKFTEFYYEEKRYKDLKVIKELLYNVKHLRNVSAHNSCILINLFEPIERISTSINIKNINRDNYKILNKKHLNDVKINDLISIFFLHKKLCNKSVVSNNIKSFNKLLEQIELNKNYYKNSPKIMSFNTILIKLVDGNDTTL